VNNSWHMSVEARLKARLRFEATIVNRQTSEFSAFGVGMYSPSFTAIGIQLGDKYDRRGGIGWTSPFKKAKVVDRSARAPLAW
jgi:hypothetical protein